MAGLGVIVYLDEMLPPALAVELRKRGYDVISCHEVERGNRGVDDPAQLAYATSVGRAILTQNARDYAPLDAQWKREGKQHAGVILYAENFSFGVMLRRIVTHLETYPPDVQHDTVLWL